MNLSILANLVLISFAQVDMVVSGEFHARAGIFHHRSAIVHARIPVCGNLACAQLVCGHQSLAQADEGLFRDALGFRRQTVSNSGVRSTAPSPPLRWKSQVYSSSSSC